MLVRTCQGYINGTPRKAGALPPLTEPDNASEPASKEIKTNKNQLTLNSIRKHLYTLFGILPSKSSKGKAVRALTGL